MPKLTAALNKKRAADAGGFISPGSGYNQLPAPRGVDSFSLLKNLTDRAEREEAMVGLLFLALAQHLLVEDRDDHQGQPGNEQQPVLEITVSCRFGIRDESGR